MNATCFHCGEANPPGAPLWATIQGQSQPVCCPGCQAAAEWIEGLGLGDYYRLRSTSGSRVAGRTTDYAAWDRPALRRLHVREAAPDRAEIIVLVEDLRCAACAWLIERAMRAVPGIHEVGVNALAKRIVLVFDPRKVALSAVLAALARLGYSPQPLTAEAIDSSRQRESRAALKRLIVAGLGTMQAMMMAVALYAGVFDGIDPSVREFFRWLGVLVATPVVLYSAQPFFRGAMREWRARHLSMDTPVALAIGLIYAASFASVLAGGREIYFDSVSMFVLFLLLGRHLAMRARHRANDVVDALARLQPALAERRENDRYVTVAVHELEEGDIVRVAIGATIPADGELIGRPCRVDESLVSGESTPIRRESGNAVIAGSLVVEGPAELIVREVGAGTVLAGVVRLIARAASERPQLARVADARATRFVLRVLAATVLTALGWALFDPTRALPAALAVLVVSCPCAFALAVPAALTRAIAILAQRGVLVVDADALETLVKADRFIFDKTGTLTEPSIDVAGVVVRRGRREDVLACVAALEHGNTHPLAIALRGLAAEAPAVPATELRQVDGAGVEGIVKGVRYRLGRPRFALQLEDDATDDALILADDDGEIARLPIIERLRPGAAALICALRGEGVISEIQSGDAGTRVAALARELGINEWCAGATPGDKLARLKALRNAGHIVAVVGDGINDAPVLGGADVAIAIGEGSALAHAASGILLSGSRLEDLVETRVIAAEMLVRIRQNLNWALAYNLAAVPLAAFGLVPPWLAALGMSASSILVVLNSLRIGRRPRGRGMATNRDWTRDRSEAVA